MFIEEHHYCVQHNRGILSFCSIDLDGQKTILVICDYLLKNK